MIPIKNAAINIFARKAGSSSNKKLIKGGSRTIMYCAKRICLKKKTRIIASNMIIIIGKGAKYKTKPAYVKIPLPPLKRCITGRQ